MSNKKIVVRPAHEVLVSMGNPVERTVIEKLISSGGDKLLSIATGEGPPVDPPDGSTTAYLDVLTGDVYVWEE
jgi:hypothetical protein